MITCQWLRKYITKAIPYRSSGLWRFQEVAQYFAQCLASIAALGPAVIALPAGSSLKLLLYMYERLAKTLTNIDDSGGYRYELIEQIDNWFEQVFLHDEHTSTARIKFCLDLIDSDQPSFHLIVKEKGLIALLNPDEQKQLYQQLYKIWQEKGEPEPRELNEDSAYLRIEKAILEQARANNKQALELEILAKGAITFKRCLELVERCLIANNIKEAEKWHKYASQLDRMSVTEVSALEQSQIQIYLYRKDYPAALAKQWSIFEEEESLASLQELLQTADKTNEKSDYLEKGIDWMRNLIQEDKAGARTIDRAETLVEIYLDNDLVEQAADLASAYRLRVGSLMAVCRHSKQLDRTVVKLALRAVNILVDHGNQDSFTRAINFLQVIQRKFENEFAEQFDYLLNQIQGRSENKRKPVFMQSFKASFH